MGGKKTGLLPLVRVTHDTLVMIIIMNKML